MHINGNCVKCALSLLKVKKVKKNAYYSCYVRLASSSCSSNAFPYPLIGHSRTYVPSEGLAAAAWAILGLSGLKRASAKRSPLFLMSRFLEVFLIREI